MILATKILNWGVWVAKTQAISKSRVSGKSRDTWG